MKLPLAALAVLLALPSSAQDDPNARPKLYDVAPRAQRPDRPLKTDEAKQLARDLIHGELNLSGLDLFLHRTDVKREISPEDRTWAEGEFRKAMLLGDQLAVDGEFALKAGIEREVPDPRWPRLKHGLMYLGRAKMALSSKPTVAELLRQETGALCGVLSGLSNAVESAAQPKDEASEVTSAEIEKRLAEDRAELADVRKKLGYKMDQGSKEAAERAEKARSVADGKFAPARTEAAAAGAAAAMDGGARAVTAEQAAREAAAAPRAQRIKRAKPAEPPAP